MAKTKDDGVVFVGSKPLMNYVTGVRFIAQKKSEAIIKARGKFITKAVDIAEIVKRKENMEIKNIKSDSEEFENKEGRNVHVSTIEITLSKKQAS